MKHKIFLTGGTGYIGGGLLTKLQSRGFELVCLARRPEALAHKVSGLSKIIKGEMESVDSICRGMEGMDTAFYLVHSMGSNGNFEELDRLAASNFAQAAQLSGLKRIIYLGGLGDSTVKLSAHLRSRQEIGQILKNSGAQVLEFRASIVIGSGSLSFELVRSLVDRLPVLIMPKWVQVPAQPIWINDLLDYLLESIDLQIEGNQIFEIGGRDVVSYRGIMEEYARQMRLNRLMVNVPVLTPYLSSLWLGLITPVFARTGRKLIGSLKHPTIVKDKTVKRYFKIKPLGLQKSIEMSIKNEDMEYAETRWADALSSSRGVGHIGGIRYGRRIVESRQFEVLCSPQAAFSVIESIGGTAGWKFANWAWQIRGFVDLLFGGVGLRRGRPHPNFLHVGDTVDWWRVEQIVPQQMLLLSAEMKTPGRAWLKFEINTNTKGKAGIVITQTAIYDPKGIWGQIYWYAFYPIHIYIFSGMLKAIAHDCRTIERV